MKNSSARQSVRKLCLVALFLGLNIVLSSSIFSVPVPGGHMYLNDIVICFAALVFDPISAIIVGGIGAFLGDLIFYPTPMFVSLVTRSVQALVIALIVLRRKNAKFPRLWRSALALLAGAVIMVVGYSLGRAFIYSTPEYAWLKLPFQIAQAVFGAVVALVLLYATPLKKFVKNFSSF